MGKERGEIYGGEQQEMNNQIRRGREGDRERGRERERDIRGYK